MLLGPPGVGKGTQAQYICEHFNIPQISTGNILRAAIGSGSELGNKAKQYLDNGQLVPDDVIIEVVKQRLSEADCENGFLLDGFPRTTPQADSLRNNGVKLDYVVVIDLAQEEIVKRLSGRRTHAASGRTYHVMYNPPKTPDIDDITGDALMQREDDKEEVIIKRLAVYQDLTQPLINYYQNMASTGEVNYVSIDGQGSVDQVKQQIFSSLTSNLTA